MNSRTDEPTPNSWRMSPWLSFCLGAMALGALHILMDFGVGLFPMQGSLTFWEGTTLILVSIIHVWWSISFVAGTHNDGGGVASAGLLALGWTALTNGSSVAFCPPACPYAAPLSDVAHIGSLVLGVAAAVVAFTTVWRRRMRVRWSLPSGAIALVVVTIVALANATVDL